MTNKTNKDIPATVELEAQRCIDSLEYLSKYSPEHVSDVIKTLLSKSREQGISIDYELNSPYINTIPENKEPDYPGDLEIEEKLEDVMRWNAMAMVVSANRQHDGLGGHISSYASAATIYEVPQNHIFKGNNGGHEADLVYFQGHTSPGNYSRAFLEGRLEAKDLHNFRQELAKDGGLSSYPHPYLMPKFWQFPTVSMGLGPLMSLYQARFLKYLQARELIPSLHRQVWCYIGDGECDEPETLGALTLASRENLNNLTFIINCNLQRLDGPVRGNGKMIQELEAIFRGAGWHVIKVIWGENWNELLSSPQRDLLIKRMEEAVDGEYQKYVVEPGSYFRKHFFGKYPALLELVNHLTDAQLKGLLRGGHDPKKVYAAFKAARDNDDGPTVILAKTVKGYGLGEAGEGKNISHQQKKLNEKELREFRDKLNIPLDDEDVVDAPFYRLEANSKEQKYLLSKRKELGGFLPERKVEYTPLDVPDSSFYTEFHKDSGASELSTTMGFVRLLTKLLRDKNIGKNIVPIIPDEARTFGMESLFRSIGIYSSKGQLYEPVDSESLLYYREEKDGQILEEGINEAGAMCSFISAGTAYATHGIDMIPFYIYYSMFGFQRIGDLMWLAGDMMCKGFLLGGTSGRTTLNGEGLQHQDGHSHLLATTIPSLLTYDTAYRFEIAVIIEDGMRRMYKEGENVFYYISLCNENYTMPEMPEGAEEGILKGLYQFKSPKKEAKLHVNLIGSGSILNECLKAEKILADDYNVSSTIWGATNYKQLRTDALNARRWNMFHPDKKPKTAYIEETLAGVNGPFVSASDNMKLVADQIAPWVPNAYLTLGTDGFGKSETRENLRRYFEVDAECIVIGALYQLVQEGTFKATDLKKAIKNLGVDPEKVYPICN